MHPGPSNSTNDSRTVEFERLPNSPAKGGGDNGHEAAKNAGPMEKNTSQEVPKSTSSTHTQINIVDCRIFHFWKEDNGNISHWKATVLEQIAGTPSLYFVIYDNMDSVYGLELHNDKRILSLKVLSEKIEASEGADPILAETIIGKEISHLFEGECVHKNHWRGMVLGQIPVFTGWYYITYKNDPILYMYKLLDDYKEGNIHIIPHVDEALPEDVDLEIADDLIGKHIEYEKEDSSFRIGKVIHKVESKASLYFIKFEDHFHIYVYELVKKSLIDWFSHVTTIEIKL